MSTDLTHFARSTSRGKRSMRTSSNSCIQQAERRYASRQRFLRIWPRSSRACASRAEGRDYPPMETQSYANHRHQPRLNGFGFLLTLIAIVSFAIRGYGIGGHVTMGIGLACVIGAILTLLVMSRLYITRLQDRIIKLEMRVRAAEALSPAQRTSLARLSK